MSAPPVLAEIAWGDLLEVVLVGGAAGIGLSIAFAFLVRGVIQAGAARREGRTSAVAPNVALAAVAGVVCLAAVVFAVYEMVEG
jgi:NADP-dependent 3-hydroxy acid dehydrogenase YdfG